MDYQAINLYYHLRIRDLAYFLRLTLRDQSLAVHRLEFSKHVKTNQKISEVLKFLFDSNTKRETDKKALQRLEFETILKEAFG